MSWKRRVDAFHDRLPFLLISYFTSRFLMKSTSSRISVVRMNPEGYRRAGDPLVLSCAGGTERHLLT